MSDQTLSRSLQDAKQAFESNNPELSRLAHSGGSDKAPFCAEQGHKTYAASPFVRNHAKTILSGGTQGVIISCVVVSVVIALGLEINGSQLVTLCLCCLSGISAALGHSHYLEKKAEKAVFDQEYKREKWECDNYLEGEQKEMVELYVSKGMTQADAETVIRLISKNQKMFVDIMMVEELGLLPYNDLPPWWGGCVRFLSVLIIGSLPLISFTRFVAEPMVVHTLHSLGYQTCLGIAFATLVLVGVLKDLYFLDMGAWWKQGLQTTGSGVIAVVSAIAMGHALRILFI